jgi:hypothetical protein
MPLLSDIDIKDISDLGQCWVKYEGEFKNDGINLISFHNNNYYYYFKSS